MTIRLSDAEKAVTDDRTIQQSLEIIRRRIDEVGTREPTIQRQGSDRILIQVPGIGSAAELKALIGTTAKLTFNSVVATGGNADAPTDPGQIVLPDAEREGVYYTLEESQPMHVQDGADALTAILTADGNVNNRNDVLVELELLVVFHEPLSRLLFRIL